MQQLAPDQIALVNELEPVAAGLLDKHVSSSKEWFPHELVPWSRGRDFEPLLDELVRVERILPVLLRPGAMRRGQVYLSQDEAWEFMTILGPAVEAAGFEVRVPSLSRRSKSISSLLRQTGKNIPCRKARWPVGVPALCTPLS